MSVRLEEENNKITLPLLDNAGLSDDEHLGMASDTHTSTRSFSSVEEYELVTKREKIINQAVEDYKNSALIDGSHVDMSNGDQMTAEIRAKNLDNWYNSGEYGFEIEPVLKIARDKNKLPSDLMAEDTQYLSLVSSLAVKEAIPKFKGSTEKQESISSSFSQFNDEAQRAKSTLDLIDGNSIDSRVFDIATEHNIPPSMIVSDNPETKKLLERFNTPQLDTSLDTPVTFRFMQNAEFAAKAKEDVGFLQKIEEFYNSINDAVTLPKLWDETEEEHRARLQSGDTYDSLKYGMMSMGVGVLNLANRLYKQGVPGTSQNINYFADTLADKLLGRSKKNTLFDNIVTSAARISNEMPRDFVSEYVKELYKKEGFFVALGSLMVDYQKMVNFWAQDLPSVLVTRKFVPGDSLGVEYSRGVLKDYLTGSSSSIVEGADKSNSLEHSQNKLTTSATISNLSAFVPAKTSSSIVNYFVDQLTSSLTSSLATLATEGSGSVDDVVASFIISNMMTPLNKTIDGSYRKIAHDLSNDKQNVLMSSMARSNLAKQHPEIFEGFVHEFLKNKPYKNVYVSADELYKILAENNKDAYQVVTEVAGDPNTLTRALLSKGNIEFPTEKFITSIVPNISDFSKLQDHLKYSQTGLTNHEKSLLAGDESKIRKNFNDNSKKNTIDLERYKELLKKQLDKKVDQPQAEQNALATLIFSKVFDDAADIKVDNNIKEVNVVDANKANYFIKLDKIKGVVELNVGKEVNLTTYLQDTTALFLHSERVLTNADNNLLIKQYLKVDDITTITPKQQSKWVKSFENYMKTGRLDDQRIKPVFDQYKQVIIQFYKENQALGANFDAEVRQTLDLLDFTKYATNYSASYQPVFSDASAAGMSTKDFDAYQQHFKETSSYVSDKVFHQRVAELNNERNKLWRNEYKKIKQQVANDVQNDPVLQLINYLEKGILKDGSRGEIIKLDTEAIEQRYGKNVAKQLAGLTQKNGMSLESFADTWGFKSSDDMVSGLLYEPQNKKDYIALNTKKRMQQFDYLLDRADIAKQVQQSLESEKRETILATEESLLQQKYEQSNGKTISKEAAASMVMSNDLLRATARKMVKERIVKPFDLEAYLITMRRENLKAVNASKKQDWKSALESKNAERLNFFLYHEASKEINRQNTMKKQIIHKLKQTVL